MTDHATDLQAIAQTAASLQSVMDASRDQTPTPGPDEFPGDGIHYLPHGGIRVVFSDDDGETVWLLRRPKLGEMRRLDTTREETLTEIQGISERAKVAATGRRDKRDKIMNDARSSAEKKEEKLAELRAEDHASSVEVREGHHTAQMAWWATVFATVGRVIPGGDPIPDDQDAWPGYFLDPNLPAKFLAHWRTTP